MTSSSSTRRSCSTRVTPQRTSRAGGKRFARPEQAADRREFLRCQSGEGTRNIRFERRERPLNAMPKRGIEIDAVAQIAKKIGNRNTTGFGEKLASGDRADRVRQL